MRRVIYLAGILLVLVPLVAAIAGMLIGPGILHPANLNPERLRQTAEMLERTSAKKQDFDVTASDGAVLRGWKVRPPAPNGDWVLLFHGVSDNRTGMLGAAEFLLRHHFSLVMMDARAHGKSGGEMATYGWKERFDTVAITQALFSTESVHHLYALGASMGGAIALQSAAVEPRIEAVVAEAPFASLREVSYDYAGLDISPLLGKTLLWTASFFAMREAAQAGQFDPGNVSPEKAVAQRAFPVLLICGTRDHRIPCRHAERIYRAARGTRELWVVEGAGHAAAFGVEPRKYEDHVIGFLENHSP
jgi:alpha-beta hydrolase superfamily lysophospholipase